jgi:predicted DNA-binding protein
MPDKSRLTIDLASTLHARLKIIAAKRGTSMRDYTVEAIERRLAEEPAEYLTAEADPVLGELWDNDDDRVYDEL